MTLRFEALPGNLTALAAATKVPPERLRRLLRGLQELKVVRPGWVATSRGQLLRADHPTTLADAALEYGRHLVAAWQGLAERLRGPERGPEVFKAVAESARCAGHHRMLRSYARRDYGDVALRLKLPEDAVVLDVGAGTGTLSKLILEHKRQLGTPKIFLLDLPEVLESIEDAAGLERCPVDLLSDWNTQVPWQVLLLISWPT